MSIVALRTVDANGFAEQITQGRRWLLATQAEDGGWGDAVMDAANINATSLRLARWRTHSRRSRIRKRWRRGGVARRGWRRFGGWRAVGDPNRCTLSGPCRTVAALAGILDWRRIKRLRPEVILLCPRPFAAPSRRRTQRI